MPAQRRRQICAHGCADMPGGGVRRVARKGADPVDSLCASWRGRAGGSKSTLRGLPPSLARGEGKQRGRGGRTV
eukprot:241738-Chlamydomonas_euryale.AAC.1